MGGQTELKIQSTTRAKKEEPVMENTEKKFGEKTTAPAAELTQSELDKVAGGGTVSAQPNVSDMQITKPVDQSSPKLYQ